VITDQSVCFHNLIFLWPQIKILTGQCQEILFFFHEPVSSKPLIIPLGPLHIFPKIHEDIRSSRCTIGVFDTGGKWKKSSIREIFIISFKHLWVVELAFRYIFFFKFILSCQQFDNCSHCLPPVSFTMVANLPTVFLIPVAICRRFH
jgi:hypothetical protein